MRSCFSRAASVACALTTGFLSTVVIDGGRFEIERVLDQFERRVTVRAPIGRVGGRAFALPNSPLICHAPSAWMWPISTPDGMLSNSLVNCCTSSGGNQDAPSRTSISVAGKVCWLDGFQRLDIFGKARVGTLTPHPRRQVSRARCRRDTGRRFPIGSFADSEK